MGNSWLRASEEDVSSGNYDIVFVDHCFSSVYFGLRDQNLSHTDALAEADAFYLKPLVQLQMDHAVGVRNGGLDFVAVSSFDLGRADFFGAAQIMQNWTVLSLNGSPTWLEDADAYAIAHP